MLDHVPPPLLAFGIFCEHREHAAAIFLLIEFFPFRNLIHHQRTAVLAPVVPPEGQSGIFGGDRLPAGVDLVHILPAGNAAAGREYLEMMFVGIEGRELEAHIEAHRAAKPPLGRFFKAPDPLQPLLRIVTGVHERDILFFRVTDDVPFSQLILLLGMDIRIVKQEREIDPGIKECVDDIARTGRAAAVHQHLLFPVGGS